MKTTISLKFLLGFILAFFITSESFAQKDQRQSFKFCDGDLLFQNIDCGPMCDAIKEVTHGYKGAEFSHVGVFWFNHNNPMVIEAISAGVSITPLNKFLKRSVDEKGNPKVAVGRLNERYRKLIPTAISEALKLVGKPYDDAFDINNDAYYCSELVYLMYLRANNNKPIFSLAPMTYKSPKTGKLYPVWKEYFENLKIPVPEGKPGLNPGGISCSNNIKVFFLF